MTDSVLIIDAHNALWRASSRMGRPVKHRLCTVDDHKEKHGDFIHCACGSPWNNEAAFCYGDKYYLVYSFFRNLRPIIEKFSPDKCFFVLEGRPEFRYALLPGYKSSRIVKTGSKSPEVMDKFLKQKAVVLSLLKHLPVSLCRAADYEADDLIGTLCEDMKEENVTVLSNDSDFIQILQRGYSNVNIYNPIKKAMMVAPEYHYVCWKSLNGDKADDIPKILKPKKALQTVQDPKLFQAFLRNDENKILFNRNRDLIELRDVPLDNLEFIDGERDFASLKTAFSEMKFASIINDKSWEKFTETFNCLKY